MKSLKSPIIEPLEARIAPAVISIAAVDASKNEGSVVDGKTTFSFVVSIPSALGTDLTVDASIMDGIATLADGDYIAKTQTVTIPAGSTQAFFTAQVNHDTKLEGDETFSVQLTNPSVGNAISNTAGSATATITNDDAAPTLSIVGSKVYEGNAGNKQLTFTVQLSNAADQPITFNWNTSDATGLTAATAGVDYLSQATTQATIPAGATSVQFTVDVVGDTDQELEELFFANISLAKLGTTDLTITTPQATGRIGNDEITVNVTGAPTTLEGNSLTEPAQFTVHLSEAAAQDVTVTYVIEGVGTNKASAADFQTLTGTVVVPAGQTSANFLVQVVGDTLFENTETYEVKLTNAVNAQPTAATAVGTITDNDAMPTVSILPPSEAQKNEGSTGNDTTDFNFRVVLSQASGVDVKVKVSTISGTATAGDGDFTGITEQEIIIPAGQTEYVLPVKVKHDTKWESNETFSVELSSPTNATLGTTAAQATIVNDDPLPTLTISDSSVTEGPAGTKFLTFTVTMSSAAGEDVNFNWSTVAGTATAGSDFTSLVNQTGTITKNSTNTTIQIEILGDAVDEADETLFVNLSNALLNNPNGAAIPLNIGDSQGAGKILNDDLTVSISGPLTSVAEGNNPAATTPAVFTVSIPQASTHPVDVFYTIGLPGDSATAGSDYKTPTGPLKVTIPAGATSATIAIEVNGDVIFDGGNETFSIKLASADGAMLGTDTATATITEEEAAPTLSIANVQVTEGNSGTKLLTFVVTADRASDSPITFNWSTMDGSALGGGIDFQSIVAQAETLAAGSLTKSISVFLVGDTQFEGDETFTISLANAATGGTNLNNPTAIGTITNDDAVPKLQIDDAVVAEGNGGPNQFLTFTVSLRNANGDLMTADQAVQFDWGTALGSALPNVDYTAVSSTTGTINAGASSTTITVEILGDTVVEADETVQVSLANAHIGAMQLSFADSQATGTIQNDDVLVHLDPAPTIVEGNSGTANAVFTVHLSQPSSVPITFTFDVLEGTAKAGTDYTIPTTRTITIQPNQTTAEIIIPIVGDTIYETNETFTVKLTGATNAILGTDSTVATITENDPQPALTVSNVSVEEGDSGTKTFTFRVSLINAATDGLMTALDPVTFTWTTADGTAIGGNNATFDYIKSTNPTTATIPAGQNGVDISITVNGDQADEVDEQFFLNIANAMLGGASPTALAIKNDEGTGTIENDDATVRISGGSLSEGTGGTKNFNFALSLLQASAHDVVVTLSLANGTAMAGVDYQIPGNLTVVIPAGQTTVNYAVPIIGDALSEANETFTAAIVSATDAKLGTATATATITDDDTAPTVNISSPTVTEGNSGNTAMTFQISLSAASGQPVTVLVTPQGVTAIDGSDYSGSGQTITFAPGETTKDYTIQVKGDTLHEKTETLNAVLSNASGATIGTGTGVGTITNDDAQPTLSISDVTLSEGSGSANTTFTFTVTLSSAADQPVTFDLATLNGSGATGAVAGIDYLAKSQGLTIPAGQTSATFTVNVKQDALFESDEQFSVNLTNAKIQTGPGTTADLVVTDATGVGTITNDDAPPTLSINDVTVVEGASGTKIVKFTVALSSVTESPVTFKWSTGGGTATAGDDYVGQTAVEGVIPAGQTFVELQVTVNGDGVDEADENFFVNLSDAKVGSTPILIADAQGEAKLLNDDLTASISDVTVVEGSGGGTVDMVFTVTLSGAHNDHPVTLHYHTEDGTATSTGAAPDFQAIGDTTLTFAPGETVKTIVVKVNKDSNYDLANAFKVVLTEPTGAQIADSEGVGTITDDDVKPVVSIDSISRVENADGASAATTQFTFHVTLDHASDQAITVLASTVNGTAVSGSDYTALALQNITFAPGETEKTVVVTVNNDALFENDETFKVVLSDPTNATLGQNFQGTGTILQDTDAKPTIKVVSQQLVEGLNGEKTMIFTVQRTGDTGADITFDYETITDLGDTATEGASASVPGVDYLSKSGSITMGAGETTKTIEVKIVGDAVDEGDETFTLSLTNIAGAALASPGDDKAKGTIQNDDLTVSLTQSTYSLVEGNAGQSDMLFTVALSSIATHDVTVTYTLTPGTATAGTDYQVLSPLKIVIPAGQLTADIRVPIQGDTTGEANETLTLTLAGAEQAVLGTTNLTATGTILNDDAAISISDGTVVEGNDGTRNMVFTVTLSGASTFPVTVHYQAAEGDAQSGYTADDATDFTAIAGDLTFNPGETTKQILVPITGDTTAEGEEKFLVTLSDPKANNVAVDALVDATADGRIQDDEVFISIGDAEVSEGDSGTTTMTFTISVAPGLAFPINVTVSTLDFTAISTGANPDFIAKTETLTFAANELFKTFTVTVKGDRVFEANSESFKVMITDAGGGQIVDGEGIGVISNSQDTKPTISVSNATVVEGNAGTQMLEFTVSLTQASDGITSFDASTLGGSATAGVDFTGVNGTFQIPAGETSIKVQVPILGDTTDEAHETLSLTITNAKTTVGGAETALSFGTATGAGTILNDDQTVSIGAGEITEGDAGQAMLLVPISLSSPATRTITVTYSIVAGTATQGTDYLLPGTGTLTVTFLAGEQTTNIAIPIVGDTLDENDETLTVNILSVTDAQVGTASAVGTINDNDQAPTLTVGDITVQEGAGATFTVTLDKASGKDTVVKWITTGNGTAIGGDGGTITSTQGDYKAFPIEQTFVIPAGSTTGTFVVPTVNDTIDEAKETFGVQISYAQEGNPNPVTKTATATIAASDLSVFSISDAQVVEGNSGQALMTFTITRAGSTTLTSRVLYSTADAFAISLPDDPSTPGVDESLLGDFVRVGATEVVFAPGETTKTITIAVNGDALNERDETFRVNLSLPADSEANPSQNANATLGTKAQGLGTIKNDEVTFRVERVDNGPLTVPEEGAGNAQQFVEFYVYRDGATDLPSSVTYSTVANDASGAVQATSGTDFTATSGTIFFAAGETRSTVKIRVPIIADSIPEGDETFKVKLTGSTDGVISSTAGEAVVTIDDTTDRGNLPLVKIEDASVTEGPSGTKNLVFKVKLVGTDGLPKAAGGAITIFYNTVNGTAEAGTDFTGAAGGTTITIAAGQTEGEIVVPILGDAVDEADEQFTVQMMDATFAVPGVTDPLHLSFADGDQTATGTILNDDLAITVSSVPTEAEGNNTHDRTFTISIPQASTHDVFVTVKTKDGSAISAAANDPDPEADFTSREGIVVKIPAGQTSATFTVEIRGDAYFEQNETFTLEFSDVKGGTMASTTFSATILNDDAQPSLSIGDASIVESNNGQMNLIFTVTLTGATKEKVFVDFATVDGSAKSSGPLLDFLKSAGTREFAASTNGGTQTISVPIYGDIWKELTETFTVQLSGAKLGTSSTGVTIADASATGTIIDDGDTTLGVTITDARVVEGSTGTSKLTFTVETTAPVTGNAVTFKASTRAGTAKEGDYTGFTNQAFTIAAGASTATVEVTVAGDSLFEQSEFMFVDLKDVANAQAVNSNNGTISGRGTILNDDIHFLSAREFEYIDVDGDVVNVKFSKGALNQSLSALTTGTGVGNTDLTFLTAGSTVGGVFLQMIDLRNQAEFAGTNIIITARPQILSTGEVLGNGKANVGAIESAVPEAGLFQFTSGYQLGKIVVPGDLGRVFAGNTIRPNGIKELVVGSLGGGTNLPDSPVNGLSSNASYVLGPIGTMTVNGDVIGSMTVFGDGFGGGVGAGKIGTLVVKGKLKGGSAAGSGQIAFTSGIGKATLGGIEGGTGTVSGSLLPLDGRFVTRIGSLTLLGDIVGGTGDNSGYVAAQNIGSLTMGKIKVKATDQAIEANLVGGAGKQSGSIFATASLGAVSINGDVQGGSGQSSGQLRVDTNLGKTLITGSLIGGTKDSSNASRDANSSGSIAVGILTSTLTIQGQIKGGQGESSGIVFVQGTATQAGNAAGIVVGKAGNALDDIAIMGGTGANSGYININGNLAKITVYGGISGNGRDAEGEVTGNAANATGGLLVNGTLGQAIIKGDLIGGDAPVTGTTAASLFRSGFIAAGKISSVLIEGQIKSGAINGTGNVTLSNSGGISSATTIASLQVLAKNGGAALEGNEKNAVVITARDSIGTATFGGNVTFAEILAGYSIPTSTSARGALSNAGATMGTVTVAGLFSDSSIVAGVSAGGDGKFGTADDQQPSTGSNIPGNLNLVSRIASVILGSVGASESTATSPSYGIVAEQIDKVKVGSTAIVLNKGAHNDPLTGEPVEISPGSALKIREI